MNREQKKPPARPATYPRRVSGRPRDYRYEKVGNIPPWNYLSECRIPVTQVELKVVKGVKVYISTRLN